MNHLDLLRISNAFIQDLIERTNFDAAVLAMPTPCREFDVKQLIDHIVSTHQLLLGGAGGTADASAANLADRHQSVADASVKAWTARGTDGTIHIGENELPASFGLALHAQEAFLHGWDLATALDQPFAASDAAIAAAWDAARMIVSDSNRSSEPGAAFGPAVEIATNATELDKLIAFTGRVR